MSTKALARGIELRKRIDNAKVDSVIALPLAPNDFGEYQGPVFLSKPITLAGHGGKTPLFGKGSPAIIVLSPGVKLKDIELVDSFDVSNGTALLVKNGSDPFLENVKINGRTMTMNQEQLIDLGSFFPHQKASSYFEIEVSGPSRVKCSDSCARWLNVLPEVLPAAGKHMLQLICDGGKLGADAFAAGEIEVTTGPSAKTIWATVHVLPAIPAKLFTTPIALLIGKNHRVRFSEGFLIGKNRFSGVPAASSIAERQSIILKDVVNGVWTIYQPWQTPTPSLVDGQTLFQGHRIALQEGSVIRIGKFEIKVEEYRGSGSLSADKGSLTIGAVGDSSSDKGFKIKYVGKGKDKIMVSATVPWLEVKPNSLDCQKGDEKEIFINVTPAVSSLPSKKLKERSAILVQASDETLSLDVNLDIKTETVIPRAVPNLVRLENVTEWSKAQSTLIVYNEGTKEWNPTIHMDCEWLEVEPANILVPAGKNTTFNLRLNQKAEKLPSPSEQKSSITFEGDGSSLKIDVAVQFIAIPKVRSMPVDFGSVAGWESSPAVTIPIYNDGYKDWENVRVSVNVPWVTVSPDKLSVPKSGKADLRIQLNEAVNDLPAGEHRWHDAVVLSGSGIVLPLEAKLTLPQVDLQILDKDSKEVKEIGFSVEYKENEVIPTLQQKVIVINKGQREWSGKIKPSVPWLTVEPDSAKIGVGGRLNVLVSTTPELRNLNTGEQVFGSMLVFENSSLALDGRVTIKVTKDPILRLDFTPSTLDFGRVEAEGKVQRSNQVSIYSELDWQAEVRAQDNWIQSIRGKISGLAKKDAYLNVEVNDNVARLPEGVHWSELIFVTQNGKQFSLPVKVEKAEDVSNIIVYPLKLAYFWNATSAKTDPQVVVVENKSGKEREVWLEPSADWLEVNPAGRIICPANGKAEFQVTCSSRVTNLKDGSHVQDLMARIGRTHKIPCQVTLTLDRTVAEWTVEPDGIVSLGTVEKSAESWNRCHPAELAIHNKGERPVEIQILQNSSNAWFEVSDTVLKVSGASTRRFSVKLKPDAFDYVKLGNQSGGIHVVGAGKSSQIQVTLLVKIKTGMTLLQQEPKSEEKPLVLDKKEINYSEKDSSKWKDVPPQTFLIQNPNRIKWSGQIKSPAWVSVTPAQIDIEPSSSIQVEVKLKPSPFGSKTVEAGIIEISGGGQVYPVRVGFMEQDSPMHVPVPVVPSPPVVKSSPVNPTNQAEKFSVEPLLLDFGILTRWDTTISRVIQIRNFGITDLAVKLQSAKWLNVINELVIPAGQTSDIEISLKQMKMFDPDRPKGFVSDLNGVLVSAAGKSIPIRIDAEVI